MRPPDRIFHYGLPETADYEPLIRPICERINQSGWVWTVESCEGHDHSNPSLGWGGPKPMIRFGCRTEHVGQLILLLNRARLDGDDMSRYCVTIYPGYASDAQWSDVLTYVETSPQDEWQTVKERRAVYARLADLVHLNKPAGVLA